MGDRNKIYSLHEPQVYCLSKGKEHKKYEFGSKASVVMTKTHGVIVGAVAHEENHPPKPSWIAAIAAAK